MKIIVAHFAAKRSFTFGAMATAVVCAMMGFVAYSAVLRAFGRSGYWQSHFGYWLFLSVGIWSCGSILLLLLFALFRQLILEGNVAVWVEDNHLLYLDKRWFLVPLIDIERFGIGSYGRFNLPGIVLELREGKKKSIPLKLLCEPGEVVIERLRKANASTVRAL
jgi:hypothetical protein